MERRMTPDRPTLNQISLVVRDMDATVAFYRRLGLEINAEAGAFHVNVTLSNGMRLDFDSTSFVPQWDSGWNGSTGGSTVLGFTVGSRDRVDALYADLVAAGYRGRQRPYDAFWGARYAIVDDPDGNGIGLMSPIESERKFWPPTLPPGA
jgi:catechol 2,3-dioxygenase-like lactoylglutathione lyase family enzyme